MSVIAAWLLGYAGEKVADRFLEAIRGDKFFAALWSAVKTWAKALPPGAELASAAALFVAPDSNSGLESRPALAHLRELMQQASAPTRDDWEGALLEQWKYVKTTVKDPQNFFSIPEPEALGHIRRLASQLAVVCEQQEKLSRPTAIKLLREILSEVQKTQSGAHRANAARLTLTEDQAKLLRRLHRYDGRCGVWAAKGEYESLWVPGDMFNMQWGYERTAEEARLSGKAAGDRNNRLKWIDVVDDLVKAGLLTALPDGLFELTKEGWQVANTLPKDQKD